MNNKDIWTTHPYWVTFDYGDYLWEGVRVYANNKTEVRQLMRGQYGRKVKIHEIELEEE